MGICGQGGIVVLETRGQDPLQWKDPLLSDSPLMKFKKIGLVKFLIFGGKSLEKYPHVTIINPFQTNRPPVGPLVPAQLYDE